MRRTFSYSLIAIVVIFFAWRFIRPMNIFVVDEKFAWPMKMESWSLRIIAA